METVREQADRLFKLNKQREQFQAEYNAADHAYFAGEPGDKKTMNARAEAANKLNESIAARAALRRLAARHPGYFRDGWRDSTEMVPIPLNDDERLNALRKRSESAAAEEQAEREKRKAERDEQIAARKERDKEIRDERHAAAKAAGHIKPTEKKQSAESKK